ncbi:phytanoyl-CoA dioxygenase family protein [Paralcaligenes sp. KSB-10]|uniref:phytanoyl-CoA dioxygenase family protein n=1 Tax=Paralcaligenes sp. KSB-10 TaxID=2901142 RepID=UPI001E4B5E96|nr:phytanoyl-CoA dioxygenase family protein [Paralcaligenes sp. KSB-10]UHL63247.1 phytanoyl-CoA dioxygenase family protein [Paralcaligenes sp. KSB-10]
MSTSVIPSYGIIERSPTVDDSDRIVEEIRNLGYAVINPGISDENAQQLATKFDIVYAAYQHRFGTAFLNDRDEHNTIRLPLAFNSSFLYLATNKNLIAIISKLIYGKFILNQQNGIINPVGSRYNQGAWHRDLPYQHFVSTRPIIINALYCVDDFTAQNGATYVLPASHKQNAFPSDEYVAKNAIQVAAPAGSFIIIDGMTYHRGGKNTTQTPRRAVNHVYTIPYIKQQILIPSALREEAASLDEAAKDLLGFRYESPRTIEEFITDRPLRAKLNN